MAPIPDGVLEIVAEGIRFFSGPDFTVEVYEALGLIVEDLRRGRISTAQAVAKAEAVSPSFGKVFRDWATLGLHFISAMAAVAMAVFMGLQTLGQNRTVDEIAVDAFESFYQQEQPIVRQPPIFQHVRDPENQANQQHGNRHMRRAEKAKQRRMAKRPDSGQR